MVLVNYLSMARTGGELKSIKATKGRGTCQQPQTVDSEMKMEALTQAKMLSLSGKKGNAAERWGTLACPRLAHILKTANSWAHFCIGTLTSAASSSLDTHKTSSLASLT